MEEISNKSAFSRIKESLADSGKVLLIDKNGSYTKKQSFEIYSGLINELSLFIKNEDVCLIAPFNKKETVLIAAAVVALNGIVLIGNPQVNKDEFLNSVKDDIAVDVYIGFEDDAWFVSKGGKKANLSLTFQELRLTPSSEIKKDKASFYILTSGSTGNSNIVALSEYAFVNHIIREADDIGKNHTCSYGCLPINHIFGLALYLQHLILGKAIYISDSRNPRLALEIIEKYRCSAIGNVPTFFNMLIEAQKNSTHDITSLKYGVLAGGGYTKEQFLKMEQELGISLCSSYGMTEASTVITNSPSAWPIEERCIGVGTPFPGVEVVFKDENGNINSQCGEICFKGYNLMLGYVTKEGLFLPLDKDGYFHTGDIGMKDENNVFHIIDRKKNIIIRGGENLSPLAIEKKISTIDGVDDVAVVGIPNKKYGEVVAAYIVSHSFKTASEIEKVFEKVLPKSEIPSALILDEQIPLLSNGKHDMMKIKELFKELNEKN